MARDADPGMPEVFHVYATPSGWCLSNQARKGRTYLRRKPPPMSISGAAFTRSHSQVFGAGFPLLGVHLFLIGDLLSLLEVGKTGALDRADVDEHVVAAVVRLNETEAFGGVEPL